MMAADFAFHLRSARFVNVLTAVAAATLFSGAVLAQDAGELRPRQLPTLPRLLLPVPPLPPPPPPPPPPLPRQHPGAPPCPR